MKPKLTIDFPSHPQTSSLLSRDAKGRVLAGLYFPVSPVAGADGQLTLFYTNRLTGESVRQKHKFAAFRDPAAIGDQLLAHLDQLAEQLRLPAGDLCELMAELHDTMADQSFVQQVLAINDDITEMSADN